MARLPNVNIDKKEYKKSNKYIEDREKLMPSYASQEFVPPETLTDKELDVWNWLVGLFRETINCRVSDMDIHLMEMYCRAKVAADEADTELKKDPRAYVIIPLGVDKDGKPKTTAKPNPNIKKRLDNMKLAKSLFDDLGLSPIARTRAGLAAANVKSELDIFKELMERSDD